MGPKDFSEIWEESTQAHVVLRQGFIAWTDHLSLSRLSFFEQFLCWGEQQKSTSKYRERLLEHQWSCTQQAQGAAISQVSGYCSIWWYNTRQKGFQTQQQEE